MSPEPALGRQGLHQTIGPPREPSGDTGDNKGDCLDAGVGLGGCPAWRVAYCRGIEGDDVARRDRQMADAGERELTYGLQACWQQGQPMGALTPSECSVVLHVMVRHICLRGVKEAYRARVGAGRRFCVPVPGQRSNDGS